MSGSILSQELIDYIIDFLHNDLPTLRACSLASRCLLDASHHPLLGTVTVVGGPRDEMLQGFRHLIENSSSAMYIRTLKISSAELYGLPFLWMYDLWLDLLWDIVDSLPALDTVYLTGVRLVRPPHTSYAQGSTLWRPLRRLVIKECIFEDGASITFLRLIRFLSPACLEIDHILTFENASVKVAPQGDQQAQYPVTDLLLHGVYATDVKVHETLSVGMPGNTIVSMNLKKWRNIDTGLLAGLGTLIVRHALSLRGLVLESDIFWDRGRSPGHSLWTILNLSSISNLKFFRLDFNYKYPATPDDEVWEVYLTLIMLLPSSVEHLEIAVRLPFRNLDAYPLPSPSGSIQRLESAFPVLKTLKMSWDISSRGGEYYAEEVMNRMKALLPEFDRRGVLQCSSNIRHFV